MWVGGLAIVSSLFAASVVVASPLEFLQARQLNPSQASSCSATYYGSCSNSLQQRSATAWCASLGYGTAVVSVTTLGTGTTTILKTLISTTTSFTATTTKFGPTSTLTNAVTKTTTLTSISTLKITQTTSTATINAAGTIESCGSYTPTYLSVSSGTATTSSTLGTVSTQTTTSSQTPITSPSTTVTSTATSGTSTSTSIATACSAAPTSVDTTPPHVVYGGFHNCPNDNYTTLTFQGATANRTSFKVACGQDFQPLDRTSNYNPGPYIPNVASLQDCITMCLQQQGDNCGGVTWLTGVDQAPIDGPRCYYRQPDPYSNPYDRLFTSQIYPPDWGLQYDGNTNHQWYWTSAQRLNFPQAPPPIAGCPATSTVPYPPAYSINPTDLPACTSGDCNNYQACPQDDGTDLRFQNNAGGISNFHIYCGKDLLETPQRTNYYVNAESLTTCAASCLFDWGEACGGVTFISDGYTPDQSIYIYQCWYRESGLSPVPSNNTVPGTSGYNPSNAGISFVSALLTTSQNRFARSQRDEGAILHDKRDEYETTLSPRIEQDENPVPYDMAVEKRQAVAKPACLKAPSPTATTSACNCVIPSSTTTRTTTTTVRSTVLSTRTVFTTLKAVSTVTSTPVQTITKIVSTSTSLVTRTTTSTVKTAASITTTGTWSLASTPSAFYIVDSHNGVAMWPADVDEIFYNVQYDDSPESTDPPPTSFGLQGTQLIINDFVDMDVVVVGQTYNGTGAQVMAFDRRNAAVPNYLSCRVTARADGLCPLKCTDPRSGGNSSVQNVQGLWYLLPPGASTTGVMQFDTFVLQAS